ncbi:hypothetical protein GCM10010360_00510 [Streptomyces nogalater]
MCPFPDRVPDRGGVRPDPPRPAPCGRVGYPERGPSPLCPVTRPEPAEPGELERAPVAALAQQAGTGTELGTPGPTPAANPAEPGCPAPPAATALNLSALLTYTS